MGHQPATGAGPDGHRPTAPDHGVAVEVRNSFDGGWGSGFEVVGEVAAADGTPRYQVRRSCDLSLLPVLFGSDRIRPAGILPSGDT